MTKDSTSDDSNQPATLLVDDWFDPIETSLRARAREFIETLLEEELTTALSRPRYGRAVPAMADGPIVAGVVGHRHGRRTRTLSGTFGRVELSVPRARLVNAAGQTSEWRSQALPAYQRRMASLLPAARCRGWRPASRRRFSASPGRRGSSRL